MRVFGHRGEWSGIEARLDLSEKVRQLLKRVLAGGHRCIEKGFEAFHSCCPQTPHMWYDEPPHESLMAICISH